MRKIAAAAHFNPTGHPQAPRKSHTHAVTLETNCHTRIRPQQIPWGSLNGDSDFFDLTCCDEFVPGRRRAAHAAVDRAARAEPGFTDLKSVSGSSTASPNDKTVATQIKFENLSDQPVSIVWVDYDGVYQDYGTLAPGADQIQDTYAGHIWMVDMDGQGTYAGPYRAIKSPGRVVIQ